MSDHLAQRAEWWFDEVRSAVCPLMNIVIISLRRMNRPRPFGSRYHHGYVVAVRAILEKRVK